MPLALLAALLCAAAEPPSLPRGAPDARAPPAAQPAKPKKKSAKPAMTGVLNVNRATEAELRLLPGIGKRRAAPILARGAQKEVLQLGGGRGPATGEGAPLR